MRALVAAVFAGGIIVLLLVSGCTDVLSKQKVGGFGEVSPTTGTGGSTGGAPAAPAPSSSPAPSGCPDTLAWDGSWDSREVGYASNHDVRDPGVWTDASPVPVTLSQKCRDVTGTYTVGDCPGTLTGKVEKNVFSGQYSLKCANTAYRSEGTFSVTMAGDQQSFMGSMYQSGGYGPERGYAPSWWGKKLAGGGLGKVSQPTGTHGSTGGAPVSPATSVFPPTSACPDTLVWDGNWDSREVGYASNHDVRDPGVWTDASPVPVTLFQNCRDVTGTYKAGDCPGTLTGKIEQDILSGQYTLDCANTADSSSGTFSVTMASDNQSFLGSMYKSGGYGAGAGFPPSWWGKKTI
jgi:hypothetical protein